MWVMLLLFLAMEPQLAWGAQDKPVGTTNSLVPTEIPDTDYGPKSVVVSKESSKVRAPKQTQAELKAIPPIFMKACDAMGGPSGYCGKVGPNTVTKLLGFLVVLITLATIIPIFDFDNDPIKDYNYDRNSDEFKEIESESTGLGGRWMICPVLHLLIFVLFTAYDNYAIEKVDEDLRYSGGEIYGRIVDPDRFEEGSVLEKLLRRHSEMSVRVAQIFADFRINHEADDLVRQAWRGGSVLGMVLWTTFILIVSQSYYFMSAEGLLSRWSWLPKAWSWRDLRVPFFIILYAIIYIGILGGVSTALDFAESAKSTPGSTKMFLSGITLLFASKYVVYMKVDKKHLASWLQLLAIPLLLGSVVAACKIKVQEQRLAEKCQKLADSSDELEMTHRILMKLKTTSPFAELRINQALQRVHTDTLAEAHWYSIPCDAEGTSCNLKFASNNCFQSELKTEVIEVPGAIAEEFKGGVSCKETKPMVEQYLEAIKDHKFPFGLTGEQLSDLDKKDKEEGIGGPDRVGSDDYHAPFVTCGVAGGCFAEPENWPHTGWPYLPNEPRKLSTTGIVACHELVLKESKCSSPATAKRRATDHDGTERSDFSEFGRARAFCTLCGKFGDMEKTAILMFMIIAHLMPNFGDFSNITGQLDLDPKNTLKLPKELQWYHKITGRDKQQLTVVWMAWLFFMLLGTQLFGYPDLDDVEQMKEMGIGDRFLIAFVSPEARVFLNMMISIGDAWVFWHDQTRYSGVGGFVTTMVSKYIPAWANSLFTGIMAFAADLHEVYGAMHDTMMKRNYASYGNKLDVLVGVLFLGGIIVKSMVIMNYSATNKCPGGYGWYGPEDAMSAGMGEWPGQKDMCYYVTPQPFESIGNQFQYESQKCRDKPWMCCDVKVPADATFSDTGQFNRSEEWSFNFTTSKETWNSADCTSFQFGPGSEVSYLAADYYCRSLSGQPYGTKECKGNDEDKCRPPALVTIDSPEEMAWLGSLLEVNSTNKMHAPTAAFDHSVASLPYWISKPKVEMDGYISDRYDNIFGDTGENFPKVVIDNATGLGRNFGDYNLSSGENKTIMNILRNSRNQRYSLRYDGGKTEVQYTEMIRRQPFICKMGSARFNKLWFDLPFMGIFEMVGNRAKNAFYNAHYIVLPISLLMMAILVTIKCSRQVPDGITGKLVARQVQSRDFKQMLSVFGIGIVLIFPFMIHMKHFRYPNMPIVDGDTSSQLFLLNGIIDVLITWQNLILQAEPRYIIPNGRRISPENYWFTDWFKFVGGVRIPQTWYDPIRSYASFDKNVEK